MQFEVIDNNGVRTVRVCERCRRVNRPTRVGGICDDCRGIAGLDLSKRQVVAARYRPTARAKKYSDWRRAV